MYPSDIISVTELRNKMQSIFRWLNRPKFIVTNNKPKAVLISVEAYERLLDQQDWNTEVDFWHEWIDPADLLDIHNKI